jgi:hypothetical protein
MLRRVISPGSPLRFGLTFVLLFAVFMGSFELSRGSAFERFVVEDLVLVPTVSAINWVTPNEYAAWERWSRFIEAGGRAVLSLFAAILTVTIARRMARKRAHCGSNPQA